MWISLGGKNPHYSDFLSYSIWARLLTIEVQMSQKKYNIPAFEKFKSQLGIKLHLCTKLYNFSNFNGTTAAYVYSWK